MKDVNNTAYRHSLLCLRRDLRLHDNTALQAALAQSTQVSICFILDPRQCHEHPWQSRPGLSFMLESLHALDDELACFGSGLIIKQGEADAVLDAMLQSGRFDALYLNADYTPFSIQRDAAINLACDKHGIPLHRCHDALLNPPHDIATATGTPYQVFTPFFKCCAQRAVAAPQALRHIEHLSVVSPQERLKYRQQLQQFDVPGTTFLAGHHGAMKVLDHLQHCQNYSVERDLPALDASSHLSVHLKFGTLSVREAYAAIIHHLGVDHPLLRQLYWRDFFYHVAFHYPHVFGSAFHRQYDAIKWSNNRTYFQAWCDGMTGFPIVDAGMRQLQQTGTMHNRVRMITASFLVKDLHIDWRWGEAWFARHLVDYDPAINNGNWQWAASTGCDAQPWFRIFNPWLQQKRFDGELRYCRHWIPEIADCSNQAVHQWAKQPCGQHVYPAPIVDHAVQARLAKEIFSSVHTKVNDERL
jgi:deoxyribodipyrimidine photo-lyase